MQGVGRNREAAQIRTQGEYVAEQQLLRNDHEHQHDERERCPHTVQGEVADGLDRDASHGAR